MSSEDRFARPSPVWFAVIEPAIATLTVLSVSDRAYAAASRRLPLPPRGIIKALFAGTVAVHVGEAVYAYRTAHENGFHRSAGRWATQTFFVGFPSLLALREAAIEAAAAEVEAS